MGLAQMSAIAPGRKLKRGYVDEINARKRFLPQIYAQKKSDEFQDRRLAQEDERLGIEEDIAHQARKKNRLAQNLGYANIGLTGALGAYNAAGQPSFDDIAGLFGSGGDDIIGGFGVGDPGMLPGAGLSSVIKPEDIFGFGGGIFEGLADEIIDWSGIF